MPADKLIVEATAIEAALVVQILNLQGIKKRITELLDHKRPLAEFERERLQALLNLATGIEAYVDTGRENKRRSPK